MKKALILPVCCIVLLTLFNISVWATAFDLDVQVNTISTCPTVLQDVPPLDKYDIPMFITNQLQYPDTYTLDLELPEGWSGYVALGSSVDSGETKQVDAVWITVPETPAGLYPVTVTATSGQTGESKSENFNVQVLTCHAVELEIEEDTQQVCSEETGAAFRVKVTNRGKVEETFKLSLTENGQPVDYADFEEATMALKTGEVRHTDLEFDLSPELVGKRSYLVKVESQDSYSEDSQGIELDMVDCYSFSTRLQPSEAETCIGKGAEFMLAIKNNGETDTYQVTGPAWLDLETDYISIQSGVEEFVKVVANPERIGTSGFEVTVSSTKDSGPNQVLTGSVNVGDCSGVAVIVSPAKLVACEGHEGEFMVSVKNMGTVEDTFDLTASEGSLADSKVVLEPGKTKLVKLLVDSKGMDGEQVIKIAARSEGASDETEAILQLENCYKGDIAIEPEEVSVCPCGTVLFKVTLKNTGQFPDTYLLEFGTFSESLYLDTGQGKSFNFEYQVPCDMAGSYTIGVRAASSLTEAEAEANLDVKTMEECWSAELEGSAELVVEQDKPLALLLNLRNTGDEPLTYNLTADGPEWVHLQPESVELNTGEETEAFLYVSPTVDTEFGEYSATISAISEYTTSSMDLTVHYVANITEETGTEGPSDTEGTDTTDAVGDENETAGDGVTGQVIAVIPAWKTIAVGIIVIIIVMILVVRFAFLVKA